MPEITDAMLAAIEKMRNAPLKPLTPVKLCVSRYLYDSIADNYGKSFAEAHYYVPPGFDDGE